MKSPSAKVIVSKALAIIATVTKVNIIPSKNKRDRVEPKVVARNRPVNWSQ